MNLPPLPAGLIVRGTQKGVEHPGVGSEDFSTAHVALPTPFYSSSLMSFPPCHRSPNPAFTNPDAATDRSIRAAVHMCQQCPQLATCAREALYAGESVDRHALLPANAVIQAGVVCRGDQDTARQLAQIAGVKPPTYHLEQPRNQPPEQCLNCHRPMVRWERNAQPPEGHVVHYARGFCQQCRAAYRIHLEQARDRRQVKRVLINGRPDNCKHCHRPMVAIGHEPGPGQVVHKSLGVCSECYQEEYRPRGRRRSQQQKAS